MKHYYLTQRDVIQEDDEELTPWDTWEPVKAEWVGKRKGNLMGWKYKVRRRLK